MRHLTPFLATLPLLLSTPLSAQRIAIGVKGGLLMGTTKAIHIQTSPQPGATAGIYIPYHAGARFELQPEILMTMNGSGYQEPDGDRYHTRTLYLQVPLSAKLFLNNDLNIQGGVQAGKLLEASQVSENGKETVTERYNNLDIGLNGGVGLDLRSGFDLTLRYFSGMSPVLRNDQVLFPKNRTIQFTAGYRLMHFREIKPVRRRR